MSIILSSDDIDPVVRDSQRGCAVPTYENFYVVDHPAGVVVENLWVVQDYSLHLVRGERKEMEEAAASWELSQGLVLAAAAVQSRTKIQVTCLLGSSSAIPPPAAASRPAETRTIPGRGFHQRLSLKRWKLFLVPSSIHHRAEMRAADCRCNGDPDRSDTNSKYFYTIAQIF